MLQQLTGLVLDDGLFFDFVIEAESIPFSLILSFACICFNSAINFFLFQSIPDLLDI